MQVKLTELAKMDIISSYLYGVANFGQKQASRYEKQICNAVDVIKNNPRIAKERSEFNPAVRIYHSGKHYIVYRIESENILIVRILRDEVDLSNFLQ